MTQDDIIRMARKVGMEFQGGFVRIVECVTQSELERFAALVAAAAKAEEREECAMVCLSLFDLDDDSCSEAEQCAAAIRARGQQ